MLACICCTSHLSDFLPHRQEAKVALLLLSPHGLSRRLLYTLRHSILDQRAGEMTENMPPPMQRNTLKHSGTHCGTKPCNPLAAHLEATVLAPWQGSSWDACVLGIQGFPPILFLFPTVVATP